MEDMAMLGIVGMEGMVIGSFFFGGLWYTVRHSVAAKYPALWIVPSFLVRIPLTVLGFYFVSQGSWQRLVACILGFVLSRFIIFYITKLIDKKQLA